MAWTFSNSARKAACDGIAALFDGGNVLLTTSGDAELANPTFNATAFGAATTADPAVATANAFTADSSVTAGTIGKIALRTSGNAAVMSGTVGVGSGDFQVADNVIPAGATSVNITSMTLSLTLS
jgi:hypothetical protein